MLNIYYGRDCLNKDQFIFQQIKGNTLLIVPDQFTLQAERDAFFYLQKEGLMDIEVLSISRLGTRVLDSVGGGMKPMINKQGRHMLLTKIAREEDSKLQVYKGYKDNAAFIELANNFLSEMKQYGTTPESLAEIIEAVEEDTFLKRKLKDILTLFDRYEQEIQGKYIDTEDYINLFAGKLADYKPLADATIWVYGFDYFTPKNLQVLGELMGAAKELNIVLTVHQGGRDEDVFSIGKTMISMLSAAAEERNIPVSLHAIGEEYTQERAEGLRTLEREIFALPHETEADAQGITLVRCANYYLEAESAAMKVLQLVREKNLRYRDIVLICNDMEIRGNICKRVFAQYGMDLFLDQKRDILHSPAVAYLVALMDCITKGYRREDVIRLIKTGLTQLSLDEGELLENYANQYRLMGSRWKKPLEKGLMTHGEDKIAELEALRCRLMEPILQFAEEFKQEKTVEEKVRRLYHFLREDAGVPQKLEALIEEQLEGGKAEAAEETAQIWNIIVGILEQLIAIVGEENLSLSAFNLVLTAGFEAVEIGVLPPTLDGIIMGTMQRTRSSRVKALLVLGANEGVLPALGGGDSILSEEEKLWLNARGIELCKIDELRVMEENLAIYKNLARPTEEVWMSCSASDEEGKAINPSSIFTKIAEIYPGLEIEKDILNQGEAMGLIGGMESTLEHVATALRKAEGEDSLEDPLKEAALWFKAYRPEAFNKIWRGLHFDNKAEQLTTEIAQSLYLKEANNPLTLSPSRLELFGKCPFSHFVSYGLRPEQPRDYTVEALDMGDLYHRCLMLLSRRLSVGGKEITAEDSLWMTISREDCDAAVEEILEGEMETYREGLLKAGAAEAYRGDRIKEICKETAWNMITQVRAGKIISMEYEVPFGKGRNLSPIIIQHEGKEIHIEGKIDRMDTLVGERIKVVDYKSGKDKYSEAEALGGWKLQLFVYLRAGCRAEKKPAGAFYFHIDEPRIDAGGCSEEEVAAYIEKEIPKIFKMDGVMVNDEEVVASIAGDFDRYSTIVPVKKTKGVYGGTSPGKVLEEEEFTQLVCAVYQKVDELCIQLSSGIIEIKPRRTESQSACTHCKFKGICKFDASFEGCEYVKIRSK